MIETSRRNFFKGLLGVALVATPLTSPLAESILPIRDRYAESLFLLDRINTMYNAGIVNLKLAGTDRFRVTTQTKEFFRKFYQASTEYLQFNNDNFAGCEDFNTEKVLIKNVFERTDKDAIADYIRNPRKYPDSVFAITSIRTALAVYKLPLDPQEMGDTFTVWSDKYKNLILAS